MDGDRAILCGVDEAGLGPLLGPLAIGYAAIALPDADASPWKLLTSLVGRRPGVRTKLVVADSKKVFARDDAGRKRLEATALSFLALLDERGKPPSDPRALLFGPLAPPSAVVERHPWYARLPAPLPLDHEAASIELLAELLRRRMAERGLSLLDAGVRLVPAGELNESYDATRNKAVSVWERLMEVLRRIWDHHASARLSVVVDRQGGRMRYGPLLAQSFPGVAVATVSEDDARSEYQLVDALERRAMHLVIVEKAEDHSFPVALASCIAKYAREVAMGGFNAFFEELQPGLKPTAGYRTDAWRWLKDAAPALRRAGLPDAVVVRTR